MRKVKKYFQNPFSLTKKVDCSNSPNPNGFTLIEMLIVIMIMSLIFGFSYANYRDFQRRKQLESVVGVFKEDLRLAQQLALAGKKPTGCTTLVGYRVRREEVVKPPPDPPDQYYEIVANCGLNPTCTGEPDYCIKRVKIPSNVNVSSFPSPGNRFIFLVLGKGVDRPASITFTQSSTGYAQTVEVTTSGEIR